MEEQFLSSEEKLQLLRLARHALSAHCGVPSASPVLNKRLLSEKRGAFVTLRQGRELRGCIGYVEPIEPIAAAVRELAVKAGSEDPRFSSVHASELHSLRFEVSILTPLKACLDPAMIEIGRHGLVVERDGARGLLLPEVAVEAGCDARSFLEFTCRKAGLPASAWEEPNTRIYTFETEHVTESTAELTGSGVEP